MIRQIKFNNLISQSELAFELTQAYYRVMQSGIYLNGLEAEVFTYKWAEYCNRKYCILTASGLDGLKLVLRAWDIGTGDRVLVPDWGCVQTWLAVEQVGAIPFVAVGPTTIKTAIRVHLYGSLYPRNYYGKMLNDACQAHGLKGIGDPAVYSFYPTKNLGCYGDGGAIVTDDKELFNKLLGMTSHSAKRMDELQCAFLRAKLPYLDEWNKKRTQNATQYLSGLRNVTLPKNLNSVWYQFVIQYSERNKLKLKLDQRGIETMIHYPVAPYRQLGYNYNLPEADRMAAEVLSLPIGPHLREQDIDYVIKTINEIT